MKYGFAFPDTLAILPRGELGCFVCADPTSGTGRCLGHSRKEEAASDHTSGFTSPLTSPVSSRNTWQVSLQAQYICVIPSAFACTWRRAQKLLSEFDLLSVPRVHTGVWEGLGVSHAQLEASVWLPRGLWIKSRMYLHLPLGCCVEAGQHT